MNDYSKNSDRFTGFADIYDNARPQMPPFAVETVIKYLGKNPDTVVDLGCGTGLSTLAWNGRCGKVIGIEPSEDMLAAAREKEGGSVSFIKAFAHQTGLAAGSADAAICSQSFHWMDPDLTLAEVGRILRHGGIFATVDNDWPPVFNWQAEQAYSELFAKVADIEENVEDIKSRFIRWNKSGHLENIKNSGRFRYCREIVFANRETCDAERFINIAMSQGSLQSILKNRPELIKSDVDIFINKIRALLGDDTFEIDFCYRMRIGVI